MGNEQIKTIGEEIRIVPYCWDQYHKSLSHGNVGEIRIVPYCWDQYHKSLSHGNVEEIYNVPLLHK